MYSGMTGPEGARDSPNVQCQIDRDAYDLVRVLPFSRLAVTDTFPAADESVTLKPIQPVVVKNTILNTEHYYWCIFQGRRVGIFYATA